MGKKNKTTNTYDWKARPDTADTIAARKAIQNVDFTSPIVNMYGQMERDVNDDQFYEQSLPEGAKEKIKYGRLFNLKQQKGAALGDAKSREEQYKSGALMNLAGMTQSQLVNSGSTQVVSDPWGTALGIAGMGAQGAGSVMSGLGSMGVT